MKSLLNPCAFPIPLFFKMERDNIHFCLTMGDRSQQNTARFDLINKKRAHLITRVIFLKWI